MPPLSSLLAAPPMHPRHRSLPDRLLVALVAGLLLLSASLSLASTGAPLDEQEGTRVVPARTLMPSR